MTVAIAILGGLAIAFYFVAMHKVLDRPGNFTAMFVAITYAVVAVTYTLALMKTHYSGWVTGVGGFTLVWPVVMCYWFDSESVAVPLKTPGAL